MELVTGESVTAEAAEDVAKSTPATNVTIGNTEVNVEETNDNEKEEKHDHPKNDNSSKVATPVVKSTDSRKRRWEKRMRFQPKNVLQTEDKHEYYKNLSDESKGETVELPRALSAVEHLGAHTAEVESMMNALKQHSGSKTALQLVPRHLRRRAASHNVKRLPRRLRELAKQQATASAGEAVKKPVNRRKRRRNPDLQNEYAKRAGKQGWLATHVWHAKRFHMSDETDKHFEGWSCRVALHNNDKCHRACYRATAKHCTIQDVSYVKCIQLEGRKTELRSLIECLTCGASVSEFNESFMSGAKAATALLYDMRTSPCQCVGPATVMWKPGEDGLASGVWLWIHPAIFNQVNAILRGYEENQDIRVRDISNSLVRFRLSGPKSSITLLSVLRCYSVDNITAAATDGVEDEDSLKYWIAENNKEIQSQQSRFVSTMKDCHKQCYNQGTCENTTACAHGTILPVIVEDPRLTLPLQKTVPSFKATTESVKVEEHTAMLESFKSPLWNEALRDKASSSRLPDHVVSTRKNEAKFSTDDEKRKWMESLSTPVPILLVRIAGFRNQPKADDSNGDGVVRTVHGGPPDGFNAGWDLIIPTSWSMAFWIPLIYHRGRAIGLKESSHASLECKIPFFPRDYPDTYAGVRWWKAEGERNQKKYYRKPPSKRPNYAVLASPFPFAPSWNYLFKGDEKPPKHAITFGKAVKEETDSNQETKPDTVDVGENIVMSEDLRTALVKSDAESAVLAKKAKLSEDELSENIPFVLRDSLKLYQLHQLLNSNRPNEKLKPLTDFVTSEKNSLICVKISPLNKGIPLPQSMICLPTSKDLGDLREQFNDLLKKGLSDCAGPTETKHWDPYRAERKKATKEAKKNRKRKKDKRAEVTHHHPTQFSVFPTREIIGFVTSGDYLFSYAAGGGIGFITVRSLVALMQLHHEDKWLKLFLLDHANSDGLLVLLRNTDSSQYRFVTLDLMIC